MKRVYKTLVFACWMVILAFQAVFADTWIVPGEYSRICDALSECSEGDTIFLKPGTYAPRTNNEEFPLTMINGVVLTGSHRDSCILDAEGTERVLLCSNLDSDLTTVSNLTITGGSCEYSGGGIRISNNSTVTVSNCRITRNSASDSGGGIAVLNSDHALIEFCQIDSNTCTSRGGGIYCTYSAPEIRNNVISNNIGTNGGGISCLNSASPSISHTNFTSNRASNQGGGVECYDRSSPTIINCMFDSNIADKGGGLSLQSNSNAVVLDNEFLSNHGNSSGGAVFCGDIGEAVFKRNLISGNEAFRNGGGFFLHAACTAVIDSNTIVHNRAGTTSGSYGYGGAITCFDGPSPTISRNTIHHNIANDEGGGIHMHIRCSGVIVDNNIQFNLCGNAEWGNEGFGGGIFLNQADPHVVTNYISNNRSLFLAGGIFIQNDYPWDNPDNVYPVIEKNLIIGNEASHDGGGISTLVCDSSYFIGNTISDNVAMHGGGAIQVSYHSKTYFYDNTIERNRSEAAGGGAVFITDTAKPFLRGNLIRNNSSMDYPGGAIDCLENTAATICENLIMDNWGQKGGAIHVRDSSTAAIYRNTIAGNDAEVSGGAVFSWGTNAVLAICNNTFYQNQAGNGSMIETGNNTMALIENNIFSNHSGAEPLIIKNNAKAIVGYNCFWNTDGDTVGRAYTDTLGNFFSDPQFLDPDQLEFHLLESSACIDAGNPAYPFDPDSTRVDVGRFYFDQQRVNITAEENFINKIPSITLGQNYPNPFNPTTTLTIVTSAEMKGLSTISIFSSRGHLIRKIFQGTLEAGVHRFIWNGVDDRGRKVGSGIYFCRVTNTQGEATIKMVLSK